MPTQAAGWIIARPSQPGISHTLPSWFHGKPLITKSLAMSPSTHRPASTHSRRQPAGTRRATRHGTATNRPSTKDSSGTTIGTAHQNSRAMTITAKVTQYRPAMLSEKPNTRPRRPAAAGVGAPSSNARRPGMAISNIGGKVKGGRAPAAMTPSMAAAKRARLPFRFTRKDKR